MYLNIINYYIKMLEKINLDISSYSMNELEEILDLKYPYSQSDITSKITLLNNSVKEDKSINNTKKNEIIEFVNKINSYLQKSLTHLNVNTENSEKRRIVDSFQELPPNEIIKSSDNFIIQKPTEIAGLNANPEAGLIADSNGAPPGTINPINVRTIKRAVNIDTRFRPDYYSSVSSDLLINLPYEFKNVINMRLSSIEIPTTTYSTSESLGNNRFVISFTPIDKNYQFSNLDEYNKNMDSKFVSDYEANYAVVIPDGNYSKSFSNSIRAEPIEQAINNILITTPLWGSPLCLRYTIDTTSGKSVFAQDKLAEGYQECNWAITFNINKDNYITTLDPLPLKCGWSLGYRLGQYLAPTGEALASEGVCLVRGPMYIYLCIDEFANNVNNYFISCYADSINNKNILARINLSIIQQYNGVYQMGQDDGYYTQLNRSRNYFGPVNISKLHISLLDEYGRILNLNNMDWSMALLFECIYN